MPQLSGPSVPASTGEAPTQLVVLLHGVGADGEDLIRLAPVLARHLPEAAFVAPDAPFACDLAPHGRQWFSVQDRRPAALLPGLDVAAALLGTFLDEQLATRGLDDRRLALVGFSQGTMLALHAAPRRARSPGAILGYSGALVGGDRLGEDARQRPPVMLVHGTEDDVVPFAALGIAAAALRTARFPVQSLHRPGLGHAIDPEGLDAGGRFLRTALA